MPMLFQNRYFTHPVSHLLLYVCQYVTDVFYILQTSAPWDSLIHNVSTSHAVIGHYYICYNCGVFLSARGALHWAAVVAYYAKTGYKRFRRRIEKLLLPNHSTATIENDAYFTEKRRLFLALVVQMWSVQRCFFQYSTWFPVTETLSSDDRMPSNLARKPLPFPICAWTTMLSNNLQLHQCCFEWYPTSSLILEKHEGHFRLQHSSHHLNHCNGY